MCLFTNFEGWYTDVRGAAAWAEVAASTIRKWISLGDLPTCKLGGSHVIAKPDLDKVMLIKLNRTTTASPDSFAASEGYHGSTN
jgi:hypothetical protein